MSKHIDLGKLGEDLAFDFLCSKKYTFADRNYRYKKGEVDLIFIDANQIVFVEVKTRESNYLTDPSMLVSLTKQKQIIKIADYYLKTNEIDLETRFDVVVIICNQKEKTITHYQDAFIPIA